MKTLLTIMIGLASWQGVIANHNNKKDPDIKWISNLHQQLLTMVQQHQAEAAQLIDGMSQSGTERYPACCSVQRHPLPAGIDQSAQKQSLSSSSTANSEQRYPRLMILVSFSMPLSSLQTLAQQLQQVGGQLVFRGLVNNSFKDTATKLQQLGHTALIDPTLFQDLQVKQVPTFVYFAAAPTDLAALPAYDILQGHVTLLHALEQFAEQGEVAGVDSLLKQLQGQLP